MRLRLVPSLAICGLLFTLMLAACGGEPATSPYPCAPTECVNNVHIAPPAGTSTLQGIHTDMDVVPMICDAACQSSSGNPMAPGYIMNFMALYDASGTYFIRAGYATYSGGHDAYFYDSNLPRQGYSFHTPLGDTEIGPGYTDTYTYTGITIAATAGSSGQPYWVVSFSLNHAAQMGAPGSYTYAVTSLGFIFGSFVPAYGLMGQILFGHSAATAIFAAFNNNQVGIGSICLPICSPIFIALTQDGTVAGLPASVPPPYANWLVRPSARNSHGGVFYTECCRPLHIDIG